MYKHFCRHLVYTYYMTTDVKTTKKQRKLLVCMSYTRKLRNSLLQKRSTANLGIIILITENIYIIGETPSSESAGIYIKSNFCSHSVSPWDKISCKSHAELYC
jgi:hypothetical protein